MVSVEAGVASAGVAVGPRPAAVDQRAIESYHVLEREVTNTAKKIAQAEADREAAVEAHERAEEALAAATKPEGA